MVRNKCIRQNWKIFNKIKFIPSKNIEFDKDNSQKWSEEIWKHIVEDELERIVIYNRKDKENKYTITLWCDNRYLYLIQVIRTEFNTDDTVVYMNTYSDDNLSDFKAISKFIHKNILDIIKHSRESVLEANKLATIEEISGNDA